MSQRRPWFIHFLSILAWFADHVASYNRLGSISSVEEYLDICPLGKYHKPKPSAEPELVNCGQFKESSCCTSDTTTQIIENELHGFDFHHCGPINSSCLKYFHTDYCFVECSPDVGPWLVQSKRSLGSERIYRVPLCKSDCDKWYNACLDASTCAENWQSGGFDWSNGTNQCRAGFLCNKIRKIFPTSKEFCEKVWDYTWQVISDDPEFWESKEPNCMHLDGSGMLEHNRKVAAKHARAILNRVKGTGLPSFFCFSTLVFCFITMSFLNRMV